MLAVSLWGLFRLSSWILIKDFETTNFSSFFSCILMKALKPSIFFLHSQESIYHNLVLDAYVILIEFSSLFFQDLMKTKATMKSMVTRPVNPQANNAEVNKSGEGTEKGAGNELHPFVDCFALLGLKGWESTWLDCLMISSFSFLWWPIWMIDNGAISHLVGFICS